jgi:hypothetical protein
LGAFTSTGDPIPKDLPNTTEIVPNCVGTSEPVVKHPSLTATTGHAAEWQIEGEFGIGLQVSHPILPVAVDLSSAIEATDTQELEQSLARGESWDLPAAPGEIIVYTLSWQELWQPGYVEVTFADQTVRRINVTYRTGIRSDIVNQERQICDGTPLPANPQPGITDAPSSTISPTFTPIPLTTPTLTVKPEEILPYQADWLQGFNGWAGDESWKTVNGMLVNDGSAFPGSIIAPYKPGRHGVKDYAVEAEIQVIGDPARSFGIIVRSSYYAGYLGYTGGGIFTEEHLSAQIAIDCCGGNILNKSNFGMNNEWHTYRVEVSGNEVRLLIDGSEYVHVTDNRFLEGGEVGLWSDRIQIQVRTFKIEEL